jgi:hypothetical protein
MGSGLVIGLIGSRASTFWRKKELPISDMFWAGRAAVVHPEKYVRQDRVRGVKV